MSLGGGSSGSSNSQSQSYTILSGPSEVAAQNAANDQMEASQQAAQIAQLNTNAALNDLMQSYGTTLTYANPSVNTGNQALAQENYMMGMPAVAPGAAPTAPVAPTLAQAMADAGTQSDALNYISANTQFQGAANAPGQMFPVYSGVDAYNNLTPQNTQFYNSNGAAVGNVQTPGTIGDSGIWLTNESNSPTSGPNIFTPAQQQSIAGLGQSGLVTAPELANGAVLQSYAQNAFNTPDQADANAIAGGTGGSGAGGSIGADVENYLGNQYLTNTLDPQYQAQMAIYNPEEAQYQNQVNNYNTYAAKGQATPADISDIIQNQPGYQFNFNQGVNAIQNSASASGMLNSGPLLQQLDSFGQGIASSYYQNYLSNLQGLAGSSTSGNSSVSSAANSLGNSTSGLYDNLTTNTGNAALSAGQAQASSWLSPLDNQNIQSILSGESTSSSEQDSSGSLLGGAGGLLTGLANAGAFSSGSGF